MVKEPSPPFFLFCGADCQPLCEKRRIVHRSCIPNCVLFGFLTHGRIPKNHMTGSCIFHGYSLRTVVERMEPRKAFLLPRIVPSLWVCGLGAREDGCTACFSMFVFIVGKAVGVFSCALSFRIPLTAFSLLPLTANKFSFSSTFHWYFLFNNFISGLRNSGWDLLIHTTLYRGLQCLVIRL